MIEYGADPRIVVDALLNPAAADHADGTAEFRRSWRLAGIDARALETCAPTGRSVASPAIERGADLLALMIREWCDYALRCAGIEPPRGGALLYLDRPAAHRFGRVLRGELTSDAGHILVHITRQAIAHQGGWVDQYIQGLAGRLAPDLFDDLLRRCQYAYLVNHTAR